MFNFIMFFYFYFIFMCFVCMMFLFVIYKFNIIIGYVCFSLDMFVTQYCGFVYYYYF